MYPWISGSFFCNWRIFSMLTPCAVPETELPTIVRAGSGGAGGVRSAAIVGVGCSCFATACSVALPSIRPGDDVS